MNDRRFALLINSIWNFLQNYYDEKSEIHPEEFIIFTSNGSPRLLIDEKPETDEAFIAIEFPVSIRNEVDSKSLLTAQNLSIVCEELSHFFHVTNAAQENYSISVLDLETIGEIDRFLCFMHWNDFFPNQSMAKKHENCLELCDMLFVHRTFQTSNEPLYFDAESRALHHIKKAFSHCWTKRWIDTSKFDSFARAYLLDRMVKLKGTQWAA
jgi:hypothetical protein